MSEHRNLTGSSLHEPKGVANASAGTVYVANGSGSGSWSSVKLTGQDAASTGDVLTATASGYAWKSIPIGRTSLANSSVTVDVTAGGLHTPASYVTISDNFQSDIAAGGVSIDSSTKAFVIPSSGYYRVTAWVSVQIASSTATIGFDVKVNGEQGGSGAPVVRVKSKDTNDVRSVTGFGMAYFEEDDTIELAVASTVDTTLTFFEAVFDIEKIREA